MTTLFLSYRRADSHEVVGRMYDRLKTPLPAERIFRDLDSIPLGKPFPEVIREALANSDVVLIVIGPRWATITDSNGRLRLEDSTDFVRTEVELALSSGLLVVPVLVSGALMPAASKLPASLESLVDLQAIQIRPDPDFHRDMDRLIGRLSTITGLAPDLGQPIPGRLSEIIDILLAKLVERHPPKKQPAEAVVKLHRAMAGCHDSYLRFKAETARYLEDWRSSRDTDADELNAKWTYWEQVFPVADTWAGAIERLAVTLYDLREVIGIFDPEVLDIINRYTEHESYALGFVQNRLRGSSEPARARIVDLAGFIGRSLPDSKIADPENAARCQEGDARDFAFAIGKLRAFIRDRLQLSPEDVFGVA